MKNKNDNRTNYLNQINTPTPPQVMDPSQTPNDKVKKNLRKDKAEHAPKKNGVDEANKLSPREEL